MIHKASELSHARCIHGTGPQASSGKPSRNFRKISRPGSSYDTPNKGAESPALIEFEDKDSTARSVANITVLARVSGK